jgi:hypothetical protein
VRLRTDEGAGGKRHRCDPTTTDIPRMTRPIQRLDALFALEFSDVIEFRSPPAVQRTLFRALAPIARWRGYRATYPQLSRTVLAQRT